MMFPPHEVRLASGATGLFGLHDARKFNVFAGLGVPVEMHEHHRLLHKNRVTVLVVVPVAVYATKSAGMNKGWEI